MTKDFLDWLATLKDLRAKSVILRRIDRAKQGNFGDHKRLNEHLYEMRITEGAGYRIYYKIEAERIYLILAGGSKKSQSKDIENANTLIIELHKEKEND